MDDRIKELATKVKGEPKCPECGEVITYIDWVACVNGEKMEGPNIGPEYDKIYYFCPHCDELLFDNHDEANEFLR